MYTHTYTYTYTYTYSYTYTHTYTYSYTYTYTYTYIRSRRNAHEGLRFHGQGVDARGALRERRHLEWKTALENTAASSSL